MKTRRIKKDTFIAYIFLSPVIVGTAIFTLYPIAMSLFYSITDFNGAFATGFKFSNYLDLFNINTAECINFFKSIGVTFIYVICSTVINMVLSYALALFLVKEIKGIRVIRLLCYAPCIIPVIASGLIWVNFFAYNANEQVESYGLFNTWLSSLGFDPLTFFDDKNTALPSLIFTNIWNVGGGMIMWIAALKNVPTDTYEAASIDGAGYMRKLFQITIPLTTNMIFYNLLTAIIAGLQFFNSFAVYGTGTEDSLYFIAIRIYSTAFPGNLGIPNYGLACAMSWVLFAIIAIISAILFKTNKWVNYGNE